VIKGQLLVNEKQVNAINLAEFENDSENQRIEAQVYCVFYSVMLLLKTNLCCHRCIYNEQHGLNPPGL
jgi:hypothetical protein